MARAGFEFEVVPSSVDESAFAPDLKPERLPIELARAKAIDVAARCPGAVILGADTVVVHEGETLGKPADAAEARSMLRRLRGREHHVITGVAVAGPARHAVNVLHSLTFVKLRCYSDEDIEASIAAGDPFDKAGAYAIQDPRLHPIESYQGCYCNVVGLPLLAASSLISTRGIEPVRPANLPSQCLSCPAAVRSVNKEGPLAEPL
jgi:MAF protein